MNGSNATAAEDRYDEKLLDSYAREMYQQRSRSSREMTDERWAHIKATFPASVRECRADVIRFHGRELRSTSAGTAAE